MPPRMRSISYPRPWYVYILFSARQFIKHSLEDLRPEEEDDC
jgi:hypothetical protein